VIAPAKGCEHFAQNGGRIRDAVAAQAAQRLSPESTECEHIPQKAG
jgi:hypothetical protein